MDSITIIDILILQLKNSKSDNSETEFNTLAFGMHGVILKHVICKNLSIFNLAYVVLSPNCKFPFCLLV